MVDGLARRRAGIQFWGSGTVFTQAPVTFLLTVPIALVVYLSTWSSWFLSDNGYSRHWAEDAGDAWSGLLSWVPLSVQSFWHFEASVYSYHLGEMRPHGYQANPLTWLLMIRPTSMYYQSSSLGQDGCQFTTCGASITGIAPSFDALAPEAFLSSGEDFELDTPIAVSPGHGWYNLTTGAELPDAVRVAEFIAELPELRTGSVRPRLRDYRASLNEQNLFYRLLNRLLFRAAEPSLRYQIFENLFSLPEDIVARFNSGLVTARDRSRILGARPVLRTNRTTQFWKEKPIETSAPAAT